MDWRSQIRELIREAARPAADHGRPVEPPPHRPGRMARFRRLLVKRRHSITMPVSVAAHLVVFLALVAQAESPKVIEPRAMSMVLLDITPPPEPAPPIAPKEPSPAPPPPKLHMFRLTPKPPPQVEPMPAGEAPTQQPGVEVSDAQLAGAATAGSGGAGGECNMPRRLQNALRKDPLVRAAVASAHRGQALMVWNGDWIRHPGQEGAGLAAVREAIMWEVGFAPAECRAQPVHGMVVISLNDAPGSARLVVGSAAWRWSDLLFARPAI